MYSDKQNSWVYLSSAFLFTEVDGKGQIHGWEHRLCLPSLGVED